MLDRIPPWLRAGLTGAGVAAVLIALTGTPVPLPMIDLGCDRTTDRYCLGAAFGGILVALLLLVLGMFLLAVAVGWLLAALLRVPRAWAMAIFGPFAGFALALAAAAILHVNLFPAARWSLGATPIAYGLVGLLVSRDYRMGKP
jgi:hypothetical protein